MAGAFFLWTLARQFPVRLRETGTGRFKMAPRALRHKQRKYYFLLQLRKICGFSGVAFSPEGSWRGVASDTGMTSHREGRYEIPFRKTRVLLLRFGRRPTAADATSRNALSREKANPAGPQPCRICKIQNNISAIYAQSNAEGILNRLPSRDQATFLNAHP